MLRKIMAVLLAAASATPAAAGWKAASSTHFVVYSQASEAGTRDAAERLEKYLHVVRTVSGALKAPDSPQKVRVFMVSDMNAVQTLLPYASSGVAGFYEANIRGAVFVTPRGATAEQWGLSGQHILFHELTHHFAAQYFPAAYPTWYQEGLADFYGSMEIEPNNVVSIGKPVENRLMTFSGNSWEPIGKVLSAHRYGDVDDVLLLYAEGWALVHYLSTTKARPGQLSTYLKAVNAGQPFDVAAKTAFGDLDKLNGEMQAYAHRQRFMEIILPFKQLDPGPVEVRALTPGEEATLPFDVQLTSGVPQAGIGAFADKVESSARRYPDDVRATAILAEAERLAGRRAGEAEAVDHWLKLAPEDGLALAAKANLAMDGLVAAKSTDDAAWSAVRQTLVRANKASPDQPRILRAFYDSYARRGVLPPEPAQNALYHAFEILPQDEELRMRVAADFEARSMLDEAIAVIKPLAYRLGEANGLSDKDKAKREAQRVKYKLAGVPDGETAGEMLARLEKKKAAKTPA